jgi:hypothetical protein
MMVIAKMAKFMRACGRRWTYCADSKTIIAAASSAAGDFHKHSGTPPSSPGSAVKAGIIAAA